MVVLLLLLLLLEKESLLQCSLLAAAACAAAAALLACWASSVAACRVSACRVPGQNFVVSSRCMHWNVFACAHMSLRVRVHFLYDFLSLSPFVTLDQVMQSTCCHDPPYSHPHPNIRPPLYLTHTHTHHEELMLEAGVTARCRDRGIHALLQ